MKRVTLKEFKSISLISDSALVWLLEHNALPLSADTQQGIMIDMDAVDTKRLLDALAREHADHDAQEFNLLTEQAGKIIRDNIESLIEEAVERIQHR